MAGARLPIHERNWRKNWYSTRSWLERRRVQLLEHPLCEMCLHRGVTTPATIADHVEPHRGDWNAFRLGKLQSLCKQCHDNEKQLLQTHGYSLEVDSDGWPVDAKHPANRHS